MHLTPVKKPVPQIALPVLQPQFAWHAACFSLDYGADLNSERSCSFQDPGSEYTTNDYLHKRVKLVQFTNWSTFFH